MKYQSISKNSVNPLPVPRSSTLLACFLAIGILSIADVRARASVAYGSVNNFDTVNDTGVQCHGFEIDLNDIPTGDITYTYDYNHYGNPKITQQTVQDGLLVWHTNTIVRYEAVWTNTGWSAYTAIPSGPIPPTMGHQFTNPNTNFGGEHFGVGFRAQPSKVLYHWLVDTGTHSLAVGPQVNVSTPVFTYSPAVPAGPPALVVAVIPAPALPQKNEFSDATWVKEIRTTSHTNTEVRIQDLMTPDTNNLAAKDWRNGEPDEVEVEWQLLQTDFMSSDYNPTNGVGGANGKLAAAAQNLGHSDDVVTRRYEYYAYVGPYDDLSEPPTHQALNEVVATDGIHGSGVYSNTIVVGNFLGAQMSAMAASAPIGLIAHLPDGEVGVPYATRSVVIASDTNFTTRSAGTLPQGMAYDDASGQVYGTPYTAGVYVLTVSAQSSNNLVLTKRYPFMVGAGPILPPHSAVDTGVSPSGGGVTTGDGVYTNGTTATVTANPNAGYDFASWTDDGAVVSTSASYQFTNVLNRSLVANFGAHLWFWPTPSNSLAVAWLTNFNGCVLLENSNLNATNWTTVTNAAAIVGTNWQVNLPTTNATRFYRLMYH
jgi:hypothetical protein